MLKLQNQVALVTGASKGIGAGIARELASAGAVVVVNYATDQAGAEALVEEIIKSKGRAVAVQGDVANAADAARLCKAAHAISGRLDILVNNAGVYQPMPLEELTEAEFQREFTIFKFRTITTVEGSISFLSHGENFFCFLSLRFGHCLSLSLL